jgi:hypothetical protein
MDAWSKARVMAIRTLGHWVRIPIEAWKRVRVLMIWVDSVYRGLEPAGQGVLRNVETCQKICQKSSPGKPMFIVGYVVLLVL